MAGGHPPAIAAFLDHVGQALASSSFIRLVLSNPTSAAQPLLRIQGRLIQLREHPALSLSLQEPRRTTTRNLTPDEVRPWLSSELGLRFASALLETTSRDWQLSAPANRTPRLVPHSPRSKTPPPRSHDRPTQGPFDASAQDWLQALGLVDNQGRPFPKRADKHRQILRYAEILGHLLNDAGITPGADTPLRLVDMGCGRGYLTFAAWQCLHRQTNAHAEIVGLEARPDLVAQSQSVVDALRLQGIRFLQGSIAETDPGPIDVLIALHACNTATDDALCRGVAAGARLLLVAPCCHQELRPRLQHPDLLAPLLAHGILKERFSEWLTDGLRSLALEAAGYRTKLIEFVASEHTPKNLLLAAFRPERPIPPTECRLARDRFDALCAHFGLQGLAIEAILPPTPAASPLPPP
jgi:hypothetical protein